MFLAIVPAFNEEKTIGSVVRDLFSLVDQVVVVDDRSSDRTAQVAKENGAIVLQHKINRGQGAALETGHEYARQSEADFVLHFDADGQFDPNDILPAWEKLKQEQADLLLGSRFLDGRSQLPWTKKFLFLPLGRLIQQLFFGIKNSDAHNGFRILNKKALQKIKITQDRMAHATEIIILAQKNNLKIIEFPVKVIYHRYGQGLGGGLKILQDLFTGKFLD